MINIFILSRLLVINLITFLSSWMLLPMMDCFVLIEVLMTEEVDLGVIVVEICRRKGEKS